MDLNDVMDEVAAQLDTISGLRCFAYPPDDVQPPAAIVSYPEAITFDETYGRGMDRMTMPVWLLVDRVVDRTSRARLAAYCAGSGASSVKAVLESGTYTAFHTVRVTGVEFESVTVAGTEYVAAIFDLDIAGAGS
jgi:hypothetical protein